MRGPLVLRHGGQEYRLEQSNTGIVLGRDVACEVVVADRMASRQHARIERRRDKFFLIDQSTNGTFVAVEGEPDITLRREEVMLRGTGQIAFGHSVGEGSDDIVAFTVVG